MCNIWKNSDAQQDYMTVADYQQALQTNAAYIQYVEEVSITGGEPFLRADIIELVETIINSLHKVKHLFINTNGSFRNETLEFVDKLSQKVDFLTVCVSIDGDMATHNQIRGRVSYDECVALIKDVNAFPKESVNAIISTTLVKEESALKVLFAMRDLATILKCGFTFRLADNSDSYYKNKKFKCQFSDKVLLEIKDFIEQHFSHDLFLSHLAKVLLGEPNDIMVDSSGQNLCRAGDVFNFIEADGTIRPCIYSTRELGNILDLVKLDAINDLGRFEPCPCCTECTIYPMINFVNA